MVLRSVSGERDDGGIVVLFEQFVWILGQVEELCFTNLALEGVVLDQLPGAILDSPDAGLGAAARCWNNNECCSKASKTRMTINSIRKAR